jgi:DNA-binding MarR family transcriptional regulator
MATSTNEQVEDTIAQQCLAVRLRMLNRVITKIYDDAFRPLGVKTSQLNILVATKRSGLTRPAEICHVLQLDTSTLSRNVERMKARGWLEVVPAEDARAQPFRLTAKGKKLLERAKPAWEQAQQKATELLGGDAITVISDAVTRIRSRKSKV